MTLPARPAPTPTTTTESPCIKVCILDEQQQCRGCGRSIQEIMDWRTMSADERIAVNQRLGFRGHPR